MGKKLAVLLIFGLAAPSLSSAQSSFFKTQKFLDLQTKKESKGLPRSGEKIGLVYFWASWCEVCKRADAPMNNLLGPLKDRVRMYSVSIDDTVDKASAKGPLFAANFWIKPEAWPSALTPKLTPTWVLLDAKNNVLTTYTAFNREKVGMIRSRIQAELRESLDED